MNFHLQEVSVHNLDICYGAFGIALVPVEEVFFSPYAEKHAFVAVRCWSDILKMMKTIELLALPPSPPPRGSYFGEKLLCVFVNSLEIHGFLNIRKGGINVDGFSLKKGTSRVLGKP